MHSANNSFGDVWGLLKQALKAQKPPPCAPFGFKAHVQELQRRAP